MLDIYNSDKEIEGAILYTAKCRKERHRFQ